MQVIVNDIIHNRQHLAYDRNAGFSIGRDAANQVALEGGRFVCPRHIVVDRDAGGWMLTVLPEAAQATVDGRPVQPGLSVRLKPVSEVQLPGYSLTLRQEESPAATEAEGELGDALNRVQREIHQRVIASLELRREGGTVVDTSAAVLLKLGIRIDEILHSHYQAELGPNGTLRLPMLALGLSSRLLHTGRVHPEQTYEVPGHNPIMESLAAENDRRMEEELGLSGRASISEEILAEVENRLRDGVRDIARRLPENVQYYIISRHIKKIICDMIFGFGPLQDLLDLPGVSEIMIVSPTQVYTEQYGKVRKSSCTFLGDEALMTVLERIVSPLGRRIDRSTPLVDARLPDGSRVNAIIPPLALKGPCVTIRRFPAEQITARELLGWKTLNAQALELLCGVIRGRKNVIVAGGTGSGKTTMLNVLSGFIPGRERLVSIEDSAELQLQHEHLVSLETRPQNVEGKGEITIRDLIRNALRMRPDRIIVGECRGAEAFDMLQAMNTGHNGSMTTIHANNPRDTMTRLESMCLMAVDIPLQSIRQQIEQAVDVVVYLARLPNRRRMITDITEVCGIHPHTGQILTRSIMRAVQDPRTGDYRLALNGYIPSFLPELAAQGLVDIAKVFAPVQQERECKG